MTGRPSSVTARAAPTSPRLLKFSMNTSRTRSKRLSHCPSILSICTSPPDSRSQLTDSEPSRELAMEVANFGFLVIGQRDGFLFRRLQPELHLREIEGVLVEHARQETQLGRLAPVIVGTEPVNRGGDRRLFSRRVWRQIDAFHYRLIHFGAVRAESINDAV